MIAGCDCYVSLHRSEGLGLTMAEAMSFGKPVIATAYSGNLDFMTDTALLVPYDEALAGAPTQRPPVGGAEPGARRPTCARCTTIPTLPLTSAGRVSAA